MIASSEYVDRILRKRASGDLGLLTNESLIRKIGRDALRDPQAYATDDEDRAMILLSEALATARRELEDAADAEELTGEPVRLTRTCAQLRRCLELDAHCYDALNVLVLAESATDEEAIKKLLAVEEEARAWCLSRSEEYLAEPVLDPWDSVFMRPYLRIESKLIDLYVSCACYREALRRCRALLAGSPADGQGIRHTTALILARLEDERGLDELDSAYGRRGSAWMHISRTMLLYKLGRMDAARRALNGLATLCPGAAFFLACPSYVPPYLPDRPPFAPGSEDESLFASYEADFLVVDTPDFMNWAESVPTFMETARKFGRRRGEEI